MKKAKYTVIVLLVFILSSSSTVFAIPRPPAALAFLAELAAGYAFGEFVDWLRGRSYEQIYELALNAHKEIGNIRNEYSNRLQAIESRINKLEHINIEKQKLYLTKLNVLNSLSSENTGILKEHLLKLPDYVRSRDTDKIELIYRGLRSINGLSKDLYAEEQFLDLLIKNIYDLQNHIFLMDGHIKSMQTDIDVLQKELYEIKRLLFGFNQNQNGVKAILIHCNSGYGEYDLKFLNYIKELLESSNLEIFTSKDLFENKKGEYFAGYTLEYSLYFLDISMGGIKCTLHLRLLDRGNSKIREISEYSPGNTNEEAYQYLLTKLQNANKIESIISILKVENR